MNVPDDSHILSDIVKHMPGVLFQMSNSAHGWRFHYLGDEFEPLTGLDSRENIYLKDLVDRSDIPDLKARFQESVDCEKRHFTFQVSGCPGKWIRMYGSFHPEGKKEIVSGFLLDVTSDKLREKELIRVQGLLKASFEESPSGVLIAEPPDVNIVFANPAALGTRGGKADDLIDIDVNDHMRKWQTYKMDGTPYDPLELPLSRAVLKGERTEAEEVIIRDESGQQRTVIANAAPVFDKDGNVQVGVVMWNDITDLKNAEKEMLHEKAHLELALSSGNMGSWEVSSSEYSIKWFGQTSQVFDRYPDELPGSLDMFMNVIYEDDREYVRKSIDRTLLTGAPFSVEHRILDSESKVRWLKAEGLAKKDDNGNITGMRGVVFDISRIKETQNKLRQIQNDLEKRVNERTRSLQEANQELESFAYSVSHDLRAPLRGIDGFSYAMIEDFGDDLDDHAKHYLQRIRSGVQRMSELIDDILKLSKISRKELILTKLNVSDLATRVFEEISCNEPERNVEFLIDDNVEVYGDSQFVRVVLENLIGNSWKYTNQKAKAKIEVRSQKNNEGDTLITFKDNGVGFDQAYAEKLFAPFQRLHNESEFSGSGIGLATVMRIVKKHGWRISAESEVNKGASFYILVPRKPGFDVENTQDH